MEKDKKAHRVTGSLLISDFASLSGRLCVFCVLALSLVASFAGPLKKKVLIIGIDGTRPDSLAVAHTPNLDALKTNGAFSDRVVTHPVTHSAACWSSMFTGVWGDKHGVNDPGNSFAGNHFDSYPSFMRRLESANSNLTTVAFTRWADLSNVLKGTDGVTNFSSDAAITTATCKLLTNGNPDVFYTILLDVDSAGHSYGWGPAVPQYVHEIELADGRVGQIIDALIHRTTYAQENWLVIVLTDHGQHDSTVEQSRVTFHIVSGMDVTRGTMFPTPSIVDVCATVLTHMEVPIDPAWNLDARVEGLARPPVRFDTNLIFNGDAESNSGINNLTPNRGVAWWWDVAGLTLGRYGANTNFPSLASPGPTNRGQNFFLGGTGLSNSISQTLDVAGFTASIDGQGVRYRLSGFFGGSTNRNERMTLIARFLSGTGQMLDTNSVGGMITDGITNGVSLVEQTTTGQLPPGTRRIELFVAASSASTNNFACADNLSLVLTEVAEPPVFTMQAGYTNGSIMRVGFPSVTNWLYQLERSINFTNWTRLTPALSGDGNPATLMDMDPPADRAFYRINAQRQ
jgi:hypothetical protein